MRIALISDSYAPYISGVVRSMQTAIDALHARGHEVCVVAPWYPGVVEKEPNVFRLPSVPAPSYPAFRIAIPRLRGIADFLRSHQIDIIHVQSPFVMGRVGRRLAAQLRVPLVFTYHTKYEEYIPTFLNPVEPLAVPSILRTTRRFCNNCHAVVVPSKAIAESLTMRGIQTPLTVIPTGIPIPPPGVGDGTIRMEAGFTADAPVLLVLGRLAKEKNLAFIIRAFVQIQARRPDARLLVGGDGPARLELEALSARLLPRGTFYFSGSIPFQRTTGVYRAANLFLSASVTETQGLTLIEAMMTGLPVVGVRCAVTEECLSAPLGGRVSDHDEASFAKVTCDLLDNPDEMQELRITAREQALRFTPDAMAGQLETVYREALQTVQNATNKYAYELR